jgi:DNA-binding NarL/FixJ family response regulator
MGLHHDSKYPWDNLFSFSHSTMTKPRILLISSQHLFGESMETLLRADSDMELVGPWNLNDQEICQRLTEVDPSVVVIADEDLQSAAATELTKSILEQYPELSVIRTGLSENIFRIFSTHTLPARGTDLLENVRRCITEKQDATNSQHP